MKWEPALLMALVLGLGLWMALGPASRPRFAVRPGATVVDVRIADTRGVLEAFRPAGASLEGTTFRVLIKDQPPSREFNLDEVRMIFGPSVIDQAMALRSNGLFRMLNITSWVGVVWVGIGLLGQLAFSGRMVLQWFISERRKESVITESFWWFSLLGALTLFSYFVWRQDPVAILGQASGIVIYARNIKLIHKRRRRTAREHQQRLAADAGLTDAAVAESPHEAVAMPGTVRADSRGTDGVPSGRVRVPLASGVGSAVGSAVGSNMGSGVGRVVP